MSVIVGSIVALLAAGVVIQLFVRFANSDEGYWPIVQAQAAVGSVEGDQGWADEQSRRPRTFLDY